MIFVMVDMYTCVCIYRYVLAVEKAYDLYISFNFDPRGKVAIGQLRMLNKIMAISYNRIIFSSMIVLLILVYK